VVLEPAAFSGLTSIAAWTMDAKAAHEGRSCWTRREGTKIGVDGLNMRGVPDHPAVPGSPWIQQGLPAREIAWIENGVLRTLSYSRYWAQQAGHEVTGGPSNMVIDGTEASTEDLVAQVERGLLVTRFWYIRFVDPMKLLVTGMTRDGLFLIENGRITKGVRNFRFNDSPLRVFGAIRAFGKPRASALHGPQFLPPVIVDDFHFTSSTSF
jgi:predicted Zn-dependent protease